MNFRLPVDFQGEQINSLLAVNNNVPFVECLLEQTKGKQYSLVLRLAPLHMNIDVIAHILPRIEPSKWVKRTQKILSQGISTGSTDVIRFLFGNGVSPNAGFFLECTATLSQPDVLDLFLEFGADVNRFRKRPAITLLRDIPHHATVMHKLLLNDADVSLTFEYNDRIHNTFSYYYVEFCQDSRQQSIDIAAELFRKDFVPLTDLEKLVRSCDGNIHFRSFARLVNIEVGEDRFLRKIFPMISRGNLFDFVSRHRWEEMGLL